MTALQIIGIVTFLVTIFLLPAQQGGPTPREPGRDYR
jgi:hypothetical protein